MAVAHVIITTHQRKATHTTKFIGLEKHMETRTLLFACATTVGILVALSLLVSSLKLIQLGEDALGLFVLVFLAFFLCFWGLFMPPNQPFEVRAMSP